MQHVRMQHVLLITVLLVLALASPAVEAQAVAIACTEADLVNAIAAATSPIDLPAGCTITVTSVPWTPITTTIVINGNGSTIRWGGAQVNFRMFDVQSTGNLTLNDLTIRDTNIGGGGGAIHNSGVLTINNSTFTNNRAVTYGGAIVNDGQMTIRSSTFVNNTAYIGGAISNYGTAYLINSTFTGNSASTGAVLDNNATTTIINSTLAGNSSAGNSALNNPPGNTIEVTNTIIANNGSGNNCGATATITDGGNNIDDDGTCNFGAGSVANPLLGPLQDNGGPTLTFMPQASSPAIDRGDDTVCAGGLVNGVDQRGVARPADGNGDGVARCDIGSVEAPPRVVPPPPGDDDDDDPGDAGGTGTATQVDDSQIPLALCADLDGSTNPIIRANIRPGTVTNGDVYCRIIAKNTLYVQDAAEVGNLDVINMGVIQAVDVFGMRGAESVPQWNYSANVCLQGTGRFFFLDALTAPRALSQLATWTSGSYTCATIPHAGTVVLVP